MEEREAPKEKTRRRTAKEATSTQGMVKALDEAIGRIRDKLASDEMRSSIGDLVRLMQMRQELAETQPRQVTVRWIDECETTPVSEE
jgi:hypothetical protein